jgi:hypothetical protein
MRAEGTASFDGHDDSELIDAVCWSLQQEGIDYIWLRQGGHVWHDADGQLLVDGRGERFCHLAFVAPDDKRARRAVMNALDGHHIAQCEQCDEVDIDLNMRLRDLSATDDVLLCWQCAEKFDRDLAATN